MRPGKNCSVPSTGGLKRSMSRVVGVVGVVGVDGVVGVVGASIPVRSAVGVSILCGGSLLPRSISLAPFSRSGAVGTDAALTRASFVAPSRASVPGGSVADFVGVEAT